jgi:hypothetical protein
MEIIIPLVVALAMIPIYAIHLGRDVKLNVKLLGTDASLEVTDHQHTGSTDTLKSRTHSRRQ